MDKEMAVLGTGAIGSSVGADLTQAGHNVLLIDQWPAHVEAMKANGLRVILQEKESQVPVRAIHLCELGILRPQFDIVFLTAKSYDTRWMVELIKPYLKSDGVLVSMQNSLNDEWIAPVIGRERDIACAFELSAGVSVPGVVKRNTDHAVTRVIVGELDGKVTPRVQEIAQILSVVGQTEVSTNIWGAKWSKLVVNSMSMALGAICGIGTYGVSRDPTCLVLAGKLGREAVQVARALGVLLEPVIGLQAVDPHDPTNEELKQMLQHLGSDVGKTSRAVILQDIMKGRQTEIDYFNGIIVKKGREANVPTPVNTAVTAMVKEIEQGKLKPDISNLERLNQIVSLK